MSRNGTGLIAENLTVFVIEAMLGKKKPRQGSGLEVSNAHDSMRITEFGRYRQMSRNGSGLIAEYLTVFVIEAWPR